MVAWNEAGSKWVEPLLMRLRCLAIALPLPPGLRRSVQRRDANRYSSGICSRSFHASDPFFSMRLSRFLCRLSVWSVFGIGVRIDVREPVDEDLRCRCAGVCRLAGQMIPGEGMNSCLDQPSADRLRHCLDGEFVPRSQIQDPRL